MPRTTTLLAGCLAFLLLVIMMIMGGCVSNARPNAFIEAGGAIKEGALGWKREHDQLVDLATRGEVDVDIDIFAGNIVVVVDANAATSTVTLERVGTLGWGRSDAAESSLGDINYTVSLERREGRDVVLVRAATQFPEPHFQHVDVRVVVPDLSSVRVKNGRGDIWIENNRGPVDIVTSRGKVRVMTPWPMTEAMTIVTSDADIDLRICGESRGAFDADAMGGAVKSQIKKGAWTMTSASNDGDTALGQLNGGTNPVVLRTSNANVMISVVNKPMSMNPFPAIW